MTKFIKVRFLQLLLLLICLALLGSVTACGNSADSSTDAGTGGTTSSPTISLSVPNVTYGTPVTATATVRNAGGTAIQGAVVTFSADSGLVVFTPTSATALTNASGVASVTVNATSVSSAGATNITASAPIIINETSTSVTSNPVGISVGGASVTLGTLTVGTTPISAYGTSSLSVPVLINGSPASVPVSVTFDSPCFQAGKATISTPVTSSAGTAISTYKDNGCASGSTAIIDTITASVTTGATSAANITVEPTLVSNIQFVSAEPETIGIKGTGSAALPQSSLVTFKVVDNSNKGKAGEAVNFSLLPSTIPGGVSFSPSSAISAGDGTVTTMVTSGTVPTPVWVVATLSSDPAIKSQSNKLVITTGLPSQNRFTLAVQTHNIEGWGYAGVPSTLTVYAFDRLGNSVPDETAVSFVSEGGGITPGSCEITDGKCSVTFLSGNPLPASGRVIVLAYAVGEESFIDDNGNNTYDTGETFYTLGTLYIDSNEDYHWNTGEQFFAPYSSEGTSACPADGLSKDGTCDATWSINYVLGRNLIILSDSYADETTQTFSMSNTCSKTFNVLLQDNNGNPLPAGTTAAIGNSSINYQAYGTTTTSAATVSITTGSPVPNVTDPTYITISVTADCSAGTPVHYPNGSANVVITSPRGFTSTIPITVSE
ncbi:MAG: hypothetical protein APR62_11625 [Smithella sp. SDB]|nr:MAG: hypothetical protein APR62_11625 [Smithella sp. SDB]